MCCNVKYKISGKIGDIVHYHCKTCRKAHGSAFSSVAAVKESDFKLVSDVTLGCYESSSGKNRYFGPNCATQIYAKKDSIEHIILRLG
ncbi:GFA family protein [Psychromonas sp.]|uniref:GFA family protein n=1 Tax=Psychromonas sp. TaxID=1884585 RepID=UPI0039E31DEB